MLLNRSAFLLGLAGLVATQETGPNNATTPTTVQGEITIHYVTVGQTENQFVPNSIVASPGDIVQFQFYPQNHSVIQSLFGWPCVPKGDVATNQPFFNSGFFPIHSNDVPTWNLTINDTSPVYFYCGAPGSCVSWGMLGVINADSQTSLVTQLALAKSEGYMVEVGEPLSPAASTSLAAVAAAATDGTAVPSGSTVPAASSSPVPKQTKSGSLSKGAIAGIAVAGVAVLALGGALFYCLGRNKSLRRALRQQQTGAQSEAGFTNPGSPPPMYQQFPRFPNEQENKDIVTVRTTPMVNTYSSFQSYQEQALRPARSQSRFSESSELCAQASNIHEMYAGLDTTVEEIVDDRNGRGGVHP